MSFPISIFKKKVARVESLRIKAFAEYMYLLEEINFKTIGGNNNRCCLCRQNTAPHCPFLHQVLAFNRQAVAADYDLSCCDYFKEKRES